tara:strand:- start:44 stop:736 length:693 start_codon:yes stop_codon:yes gene_type:complete
MRKEQFAKYQKMIDSALKGYMNLLERKELLDASIRNYKCLNELDTQVCKSILTIQDTLYTSLLIDIHSWLFDKSKKSSNLSLYTLLENLINTENNSQEIFLKNYFVSAPSTTALGSSNVDWHSHFTLDQTAKFDQLYPSLLYRIKELLCSQEAIRVQSIRDKLLAHKDGVYNVRENGHQIADAFYLLSSMRDILTILNSLFQRVSYPIKDSEEIAKNNAEIFWQHVAKRT